MCVPPERWCRDREDFIRNTLGLPDVPCEQRFCSKQNTMDILLGVCERVPSLAYIPDVLMHKAMGGASALRHVRGRRRGEAPESLPASSSATPQDDGSVDTTAMDPDEDGE